MASSSSGAPQPAGCPSKPLQRRAAARGRTATALAAKAPAFFIAFDALQIDGIELLALPYAERRRRLEVLFAARALTAPWTLCPMTTDPDEAREWLEDWTDVSGVEGLAANSLLDRRVEADQGGLFEYGLACVLRCLRTHGAMPERSGPVGASQPESPLAGQRL
ncbi:hypothetical protein [Streptomyces sp. NPDC060031]|uniref:ATP-dependent DNA ligase n=1 Tax=Streptomyces sp. NPDC060031 TaxID=3347043 RepID=UPI0036B3090F